MKRQRKIKLLAILMSITSCLLMFSMGFATWYNVVAPREMVVSDGSFAVYDVGQMSDYIKPRTDGFTMLEFTALGFKTDKDSEGKVTKTYNTISATYDLVTSQLSAYKNGGLSISSTLSYSNLSSYADANTELFALTGKNTISVQISYILNGVLKTVTPTVVNNGKNITVTHEFTDGLPTEFTIIYTFNITDGFRNNFGKYINVKADDTVKTKFHTSARITNIVA